MPRSLPNICNYRLHMNDRDIFFKRIWERYLIYNDKNIQPINLLHPITATSKHPHFTIFLIFWNFFFSFCNIIWVICLSSYYVPLQTPLKIFRQKMWENLSKLTNFVFIVLITFFSESSSSHFWFDEYSRSKYFTTFLEVFIMNYYRWPPPRSRKLLISCLIRYRKKQKCLYFWTE